MEYFPNLLEVKVSLISGYTYSDSWKYYIDHKDGNRTAWSTISYANGDGFLDHFTGDPEHPWKDMKNLDFTADDYRQGDYKGAPESHPFPCKPHIFGSDGAYFDPKKYILKPNLTVFSI